jgi:hypothetical protein
VTLGEEESTFIISVTEDGRIIRSAESFFVEQELIKKKIRNILLRHK